MVIRRGDQVVILAGKDKGKRGAVERIVKAKGKVVVTGLNMMKRHLKPNRQYPTGGIIELAYPIDRSNVMLVNPANDQPGKTSVSREGKTVNRNFKTKKI